MGGLADAGGDDFDVRSVEVEFAQFRSGRCRGSLIEFWAVAFEEAPPVRGFGWSRGQQHFPGWWWSATTGRHVGFESWLERDHVVCLDFERRVVGFSSQPFWLHWRSGSRWRRHAPDFFARLDDGGGIVVDVRAGDRIAERDAQAFAMTARACDLVGWGFRRLGVLDPVMMANLRWLSRYRHPRHGAQLVDHKPAVPIRGREPLRMTSPDSPADGTPVPVVAQRGLSCDDAAAGRGLLPFDTGSETSASSRRRR